MKRRSVLVGLLVAATLQAVLAWLDVAPAARGLWGDEITYLEAARGFARGGAPAQLDLWPPLYPRLVAGLIGGEDPPALRAPGAVIALQILLLGVAAAALVDFGARAVGDRRTAQLAAWAVLCSPSLVAFAHYLWPEILHLALLLGGLALVARPGPTSAAAGGGRGRAECAMRAGGAGVCWALASATKSLLLPFLPLLLILVFRAARRAEGPAIARLKTIALAASFLLVAAGLAAAFGPRAAFVNSGWFNAWVGLNDASRRNLVGEIGADELARYRAAAPTAKERATIARTQVRELVARQGAGRVAARQASRQYFRLFDRRSFFTDMLPGGAIQETGAGYRVAPGGGQAVIAGFLGSWAQAIYVVLLATAAVGLVAMPWRSRPWLTVIGVFLLYNLAIFFVLHVKTRYRVQFEPFLWLVAAHVWVERAAVVERLRASPWRALAAAACLGLALLFAFGGDWFDA
jgi:hypothetical protein